MSRFLIVLLIAVSLFTLKGVSLVNADDGFGEGTNIESDTINPDLADDAKSIADKSALEDGRPIYVEDPGRTDE